VNQECEKNIGRKIYKIENIFIYVGRIKGFLEKESSLCPPRFL
jgi:hypothetical protein